MCRNNDASPLFGACDRGEYGIVQLLLFYGADVNLGNEGEASPLHVACGHNTIIVQLLLKNGADINLSTDNEASPLITACKEGHDSIVHILLNNGAYVYSCKGDGKNPTPCSL